MKTTVVVTGASGFIGKALSNQLAGVRGIRVVPVARSGIYKAHTCVENYRETPVGDILVHTAEDPNCSRVNRAGDCYRKEVGQVMDALLDKGFGKVVYCSSAAVYGDEGNKPFSEDAAIKANNIYIKAKTENEQKVLSNGGIVARIANVLGPGMSSDNVVSDILRQLSQKGPVRVWDDRPVRDFVSLEDVVGGLQVLTVNGSRGIYNIGSGMGTSVRELARRVLKIANQNDRMIKSLEISSRHSFNVLNCTKMKEYHDWETKETLYGILAKIINDNTSVNESV